MQFHSTRRVVTVRHLSVRVALWVLTAAITAAMIADSAGGGRQSLVQDAPGREVSRRGLRCRRLQ